MTLNEKLENLKSWDRTMAIDCWLRYESLYTEKHGGGLHTAILGGNLNAYIDKECLTFARYARMYIYQKSKPLDDLHYQAQQNKVHRFDPHKFP